ncbi:imm11 family protein [Bacteroides cellulosilyticus]|jgi:hypothetical protein|uniref:imm11 family protein n=1 Tax=Bacteroides cellulosilyticus TaxID=246787 RepID=UPI0018A03D8C|nr:DUF1629 domain-containing protein [Bacteroides cellulosilyticus]
MKYFIVEDSLDEKVVGKDFPQAYKFIKGYNPDAPNMLFSIYKYRKSFPDYIPDLDGIMLSGSAKLTNIVSNGFSPFFFIIDERVKQLLEQYKLCPHRFYPLGLYKRKVKYNYFLLYIVSNYIDYVDCAKTSFIEYNIASGKKFGDVFIKSKDELFQKRDEIKKEKGYTQTIWGNRIVMNDQFDSELDFFTITRIDGRQYISERLKNAIEANGLTGWVFTPATNLVVE